VVMVQLYNSAVKLYMLIIGPSAFASGAQHDEAGRGDGLRS
jgi:hypothetical protein